MTRFALVHEWFDCVAGSEKVVREMKHCFPTSDVFCIADFLNESDRQELGVGKTQTSFIQHLPFARKSFRSYLPLMPMAIEQFDLSQYDVILSSSHAVAKGVLTNAEQLHVSYVHTPIRYAWDMYHEYLQQRGFTSGLKSAFVKAALHYMRMWDLGTAKRPDLYVANSQYVANRIQKIYGREASVIYPPVNVHRCTTHYKKENFYLAAGRLVPYKRYDLLVDTFAKLPDQRLIIIGDGPEFKKLQARATRNVTMLGYQNDAVLFDHMRRAKAFVFGAIEDFGIMPVEAQACGTPVIGLGRGGVAETVVDGETGLLFTEQNPDCVAEAIQRFSQLPANYMSPDRVCANAERFGVKRFHREFASFVQAAIEKKTAAARSGVSLQGQNSDAPFEMTGV